MTYTAANRAPQVFPMMYVWAMLPLTIFVKCQYAAIHQALISTSKPDPIKVEILNTAEWGISYTHTSNAQVLTQLMCEWWWKCALLTYGFPILHPNIVCMGKASAPYKVNIFVWPIHEVMGHPLISSTQTIQWCLSGVQMPWR